MSLAHARYCVSFLCDLAMELLWAATKEGNVVGLSVGSNIFVFVGGMPAAPNVGGWCHQVRCQVHFKQSILLFVCGCLVRGTGLRSYLLSPCCRGGPKRRFNPLFCPTLTMRTTNGFQQNMILGHG